MSQGSVIKSAIGRPPKSYTALPCVDETAFWCEQACRSEASGDFSDASRFWLVALTMSRRQAAALDRVPDLHMLRSRLARATLVLDLWTTKPRCRMVN